MKTKIIVFKEGSPENVAQAIIEATGAKPGDVINIRTPQFERPTNFPMAPPLPANDDEWRQLSKMSVIEAKERGFGNWDGGLFLLPGEWFQFIPPWLVVECISKETGKWGDKDRDDDTRFGFLAYGVRIGPATDKRGKKS